MVRGKTFSSARKCPWPFIQHLKKTFLFFLFFFFFWTDFPRQDNMGRFSKLVDTPKGMAAFRAKYRILENVELQHCELGE